VPGGTKPQAIGTEFDTLKPAGKCLIIIVSCISVIEDNIRYIENTLKLPAAEQISVLTFADFKRALEHEPAFLSQRILRRLDAYFDFSSGAPGVGLSNRNKSTYRKIATVIANLIKYRTVAIEAHIAGLKRVSDKITLDRLYILKKIFEKFTDFADRQISSDFYIEDQFALYGINENADDISVSNFASGTFHVPPGTNHYIFTFLPIFDTSIIKSQILGLNYSVGGFDVGLFAVVREARGVAEKKVDNGNLIVRDILLLIPDGLAGGKEKPHGIYVSTVDRDAFQIQIAESDSHTWHLSGALGFRRGRNQQRFDLRFPAFTGSKKPIYRFGLISGLIVRKDGARLAAWKVVVIPAPPTHPSGYTGKVDCLLYQLSTRDIDQCVKVCKELNLTGVLYNNHLSKWKNALRNRRAAFRNLIRDDPTVVDQIQLDIGGFVREKAEGIIKDTIANLREAIGQTPTNVVDNNVDYTVRRCIERINTEIRDAWTYLNPAQISIEKNYAGDNFLSEITDETRQHIEDLSEVTDIYEHKEFE
jgi:hypothetical protein